jgi:hypothetical protein
MRSAALQRGVFVVFMAAAGVVFIAGVVVFARGVSILL